MPHLPRAEGGDSPGFFGREIGLHLRRINKHTHRPSEISITGITSVSSTAGMAFAFGHP